MDKPAVSRGLPLLCAAVRVVARFTPDSHGRFSATPEGPRTDRAYVFRFRTKVRYGARNPRLMRTYTPPRYVLGTQPLYRAA